MSAENARTETVINTGLQEINMKNKLYTLGVTLFSLATLTMTLSGCARDLSALAPNHVSVTPSVEWEVQHGCDVKTKPKISSTMDWNF